MQAIVQRLADLIEVHSWQAAFQRAIDNVAEQGVTQLADVRTVTDYLRYIDDMVQWAPRERGDSRLVHDKLVEFHFVLDQAPLRALQSPISPSSGRQVLTPLSAWMTDYAVAWGSYLDSPFSVQHIASFKDNPAFRWDDYMPPPSGYHSFNQFFARHVRPGRRPVAAWTDDTVVVSPADANCMGAWPVAEDSSIFVEEPRLDIKGLRWCIAQLLDGSPYAHRFAGGVFTHVALRTFDYHRFHAPLSGTLLEARIVQGQVWLDVCAVELEEHGVTRKVLRALEGTGYQFVQTRGLLILDTAAGLVACLPVGMAQVSSVVITAEVGSHIRKGEELGYFQFGGSDFVMVFERCAQLTLQLQFEQHVLQGGAVGRVGFRGSPQAPL
jgi:phosphatidylserine decarboxylase